MKNVVFLVYITQLNDFPPDNLPQFWGVFTDKGLMDRTIVKWFGPDDGTRKWHLDIYAVVANHRATEVPPRYADIASLDQRTSA